MNKTVIILGAGFSVGTGLPIQSEIVENLHKWISTQSMSRQSEWKKFTSFFSECIGNNINQYLIEDLFTIFDKCILDDEHFRGKATDVIEGANLALLNTLRHYFIDTININYKAKSHSYGKYLELSKLLLDKRKSFNKDDKMSLITLNWDNYLEKTLGYVMMSRSATLKDLALDYCIYDNNFSNNPKTMPSMVKKAVGKINLKILKPHGSVNWGYCPNCSRIYVSYGSGVSHKFECIKYCNKIYGCSAKLKPTMITPTFLKDINNTHIKNIWLNTGIELSEADSLIFIGYSLRPEDFYFRYLLSKHTKAGCKVYVYDYSSETDPSRIAHVKAGIENKYSTFLQKAVVKQVYVDGWENYVNDICSLIT